MSCLQVIFVSILTSYVVRVWSPTKGNLLGLDYELNEVTADRKDPRGALRLDGIKSCVAATWHTRY